MPEIKKRNYIFRHIILIICVILILFPIVWVTATSLRRDNAAVSDKLFSSRTTFQHYRDLLFPKDNVPEIISDLNRLTLYIRDYRNYTVEEAVLRGEILISNLNDYFESSIKELENVENIYLKTFDLYEKDTKDKLMKDINEIRKKDFEKLVSFDNEMNDLFLKYDISIDISYLENSIKEFLNYREELYHDLINSTFQKNDYYNETLTFLYSFPFNTTVWNIRTFRRWKDENPEIETFGNKVLVLGEKYKIIEEETNKLNSFLVSEYNEKLSEETTEVRKLETEIKKLNNEIFSLESDKSLLYSRENRLFESLSALTDLFRAERDKIIAAQSIISKSDFSQVQDQIPFLGQDKRFYDFVGEFKEQLFNIYNNISSIDYFIVRGYDKMFKNLYETYSFLEDNFGKIYTSRNKEEISSAYETLLNTTIKLGISIKELENFSLNYKNTLEEIFLIDEKISNNRVILIEKEKQFSLDKEEAYEAFSFYEKLESYSKLILLKNISEREIKSTVESSAYAKFMEDRYYPLYRPDRSNYFVFRWYERFVESYNTFLKGKISLLTLMNNINSQISILESNVDEYMELNFGTSTADIKPMANAVNFYDRNFGNVQADLSRAGRIVSDLADNTPYREIRTNMRGIDKNIYQLQQNWQRKIRKPFVRWLLNSVIVAVSVAILTVMMTSVGAYPFSRMRFVGRQQGIFILMIIQMFPVVLLMVAIYSIISFLGRYVPFLGLNTLGGLIFAYMANISYNMWLFKGYYDTIPDSLEESAMIDGATRFQTFWKIVLPLSLPMVAVVTILTFMNTFNEFVIARILLSSEANFTYAVGLNTFTNPPFQTEWGLFTAASLVGMIPMVILFLLMQKWIVGGLTSGAVKG